MRVDPVLDRAQRVHFGVRPYELVAGRVHLVGQVEAALVCERQLDEVTRPRADREAASVAIS
jgi:hypothetical protein